MTFLLRHLLESTVFCALLSVVACCLRKGATARHAVLLMGVAKFAIPTVWLAKTGGEIASLWPAASWVSYAAGQISMVLGVILNIVPAGWELPLLLGWVTGTLILGVFWGARLRHSRRRLMLPSEQELAALLRARMLLRLSQTVSLRCTEDAVEPALRGLWRPTITIPKGLSEKLTHAEFEAVLLHELAHARRFDNLTSAFVHALVCVFWFHPLLWVLERRIQVERERACDETVISSGMKAQVYAAGILKVCQFQLFDVAGANAMTGADLRQRLDLILGDTAPPRMLYVPWLLVASLTIFMTIVPIAGGYCEQCGSNGLQDSGTVVHCATAATCAQQNQ